MGIFRPSMEILPPAQQRLWFELKAAPNLGFVLYGGTAIALRLGHRQSVDFDFFSEKPLDRQAIQMSLPFMSRAIVLQDDRTSLSVLVPCSDLEHTHIKVSFFGSISFGRVGEPDLTEDGILQVASLEDLIATKLKVILQRAEAKDYRDIAEMIRTGVSLPRGLAAACEIFRPTFQPSESLKAMAYFNDGDLDNLTKDDKTVLVQAISQVRDLPFISVVSHQLTAN